MRQPLNLDTLKSEATMLVINEKEYKIRAVPLGYLMKIVDLQESNKRSEHMILECMDVISDIIKIDNEGFERKELDSLSLDQSLKLLTWIVSSTDADGAVNDTKKKSTGEESEVKQETKSNTSSEQTNA